MECGVNVFTPGYRVGDSEIAELLKIVLRGRTASFMQMEEYILQVRHILRSITILIISDGIMILERLDYACSWWGFIPTRRLNLVPRQIY